VMSMRVSVSLITSDLILISKGVSVAKLGV